MTLTLTLSPDLQPLLLKTKPALLIESFHLYVQRVNVRDVIANALLVEPSEIRWVENVTIVNRKVGVCVCGWGCGRVCVTDPWTVRDVGFRV